MPCDTAHAHKKTDTPKQLSRLLGALDTNKDMCPLLEQKDDPVISHICYDSREVKKGALFCALPGIHVDGCDYIHDAIARGATAILHEERNERLAEILQSDITADTTLNSAPSARTTEAASIYVSNDPNAACIFIRVHNVRAAMSKISAHFFGHPSHALTVIGITGTDGKTTTALWTTQMLQYIDEAENGKPNMKAGMISTIGVDYGEGLIPQKEHQSTPEAPKVHEMLAEMAARGCTYAVVEATSHGLSDDTCRLADVRFAAAIFTNLSHDHLEFHTNYESYRDAKANLFRALRRTGARYQNSTPMHDPSSDIGHPFAVLNCADSQSQYFYEILTDENMAHKNTASTSASASASVDSPPFPKEWIYWYGYDRDTDMPSQARERNSMRRDLVPYEDLQRPPNSSSTQSNHAARVQCHITAHDLPYDSTAQASSKKHDCVIPIPGDFNIANCLAALTAVHHLTDHPYENLFPYTDRLKSPPGRLEHIYRRAPNPHLEKNEVTPDIDVIIDYAHTPGAFRALFTHLSQSSIDKERASARLIALFGSAGERDKEKRAMLGEIAAEYADVIVLCDEDPRNERPEQIIAHIAAGIYRKWGAPIPQIEHDTHHGTIQYSVFAPPAAPRTSSQLDKKLFLIPNRERAIIHTIVTAHHRDTILLLGKGHERTIIYPDKEIEWSESEVALRAIQTRERLLHE